MLPPRLRRVCLFQSLLRLVQLSENDLLFDSVRLNLRLLLVADSAVVCRIVLSCDRLHLVLIGTNNRNRFLMRAGGNDVCNHTCVETNRNVQSAGGSGGPDCVYLPGESHSEDTVEL